MRNKRRERSRLTELIARSSAGETFLVPAQLCSPVMRLSHNDGSVLRVLFGLLWLSSEILRSGAPVRFQASLTEIRIASGFENYEKDVPVVTGLSCLSNETCDLEDGREIRIFDKLEVISDESRMVEWVFSQEFSELFVSPRIFAIASISEISCLKSGLDFYLYLQVRRIWKMQRKSVLLGVAELKRAAGFDKNASFQRLAERVRRTVRRLEAMLDSDIQIEPVKTPGARTFGEIRLKVKG